MRLLCVEPAKAYRRLLEAAFNEAGIRPVFCETGRKALDLIEQHSDFEFITISFYLEDMTAIELIKAIRNNEDCRFTPISLITSESSEEILHRALGVGVTDIFRKDEINTLVVFLSRFNRNKDAIDARILCIEDTISQQQMMRMQLESIGLTVDCCETIERAWQLFEANEYDLVITDIVFEKDLGGIKLVNNIRRYQGEKGDVPILAMSAFDDPVRRIEILNRGANEYICKPILEEELIARVRGLVANKKYIDEFKQEHLDRDKERSNELELLNIAMDTQEHVVFMDAEQNIQKANQSFLTFLGKEDTKVIGNPISDFVPNPENTLGPAWRALLQHKTWIGDIWIEGAKEALCLIHAKITSLSKESDQHCKYVMVGVDITRRRELEVDLMRHQNYDQLTSLYNRAMFIDQLAQDMSRARRLGFVGAVLYIDLDNFKNTNDLLGHQVGDGLLKQVAERLINLRRPEDVVARLSGDDFVIQLSEIGKDHEEAADFAAHFAKKVQNTLAESFTVIDNNIETQASIGITLYPAQRANVYDILKQADAARYQAKSRGKNSIAFFSEKLQGEVDERARIENQLRHAISKNELYLNFQPILKKGQSIVGCEVLLRWRLETGENISPGLFIPVAESSGLMEDIGEWVMRQSFMALKRWNEKGLPKDFNFIAINCSARQFKVDSFVPDVEALVREIGISPDQVELEITETLLMEDLVTTIHKMHKLKEIGFRFSIDDFGTGFSSLRYLKQLPIDKLKIDQSFVRDIATDKNDLAIVETVIAMAHAMNLSVVAEGVETEEQSKLLLDRNCGLMQGYLYSRPIEETDCLALILGKQQASGFS